MSEMFKGAISFNQALSQWDTSSVTTMEGMFEDAREFNQNIGNWDVSNVTNMSKMFKEASSFNRNINNWDIGNVIDLSRMFEGRISSGDALASSFNQNLNNWDTSNVEDMSFMFFGAFVFDRDISNWDTSNVTTMESMFEQAYVFDQNIGIWDVSNVTNMEKMFKRSTLGFSNNFPTTSIFNNGGSSSIENWNVENVTSMFEMFFQADNFNHDLGAWQFNDDVNLQGMLDRSGLDCTNYSNSIAGWNANPDTPNNKIIGVTFLEYGPEVQDDVNDLVLQKGWGFSGHDQVSTIPNFNLPLSICEIDTEFELPTVSEDGISGSWSPEINFGETTTYTFTPNVGECAIETSFTISIEDSIEPTFDEFSAICEGESIEPLPTTSQNNITGSWSPEINNTETTTYTFTPDDGQCASEVEITIGVNPLDEATIPEFDIPEVICTSVEESPLLTNSINGITGTWTPEFDNTTNTTYTFTPNQGQCAQEVEITIEIDPKLTPEFTIETEFCADEAIPDLPTTSDNGIEGTWSPELNTSSTTTYTFTPAEGECAEEKEVTIEINPALIPEFSIETEFCTDEVIPDLPTTSDNGIEGTWNPDLNSTSTTTYTFTPAEGECAEEVEISIVINEVIPPTGESEQILGQGSTLADIIIQPADVEWFASTVDAATLTNPLPLSTPLEDNTTYYAVVIDGACSSEAFAVTAFLSLSVDEHEFSNFTYYPNPVKNNLTINNFNPIQKIEIFDLKGKKIIQNNYNSTLIEINLSNLPTAIYIARIKTENETKEVKIVKE